MGRLRTGRIELGVAQGARTADVGHVDDGDARRPAARIHLVAAAHGVMQAVLGRLRMRGLAAGDVLPLHPPARHLDRPRRIAEVVDDENVADEPFHLGRDVGVTLVDVETMHAFAVSPHEGHELGVGAILDVVDAEAGIDELVAAAGAGLVLGIREHEVADDAGLVRMRQFIRHHQPADDLRLARIGNVEDRRALRPVLVADIGVVALDRNLAAARQFHAREVADVLGCMHGGAGIAGMKDVGQGVVSLSC